MLPSESTGKCIIFWLKYASKYNILEVDKPVSDNHSKMVSTNSFTNVEQISAVPNELLEKYFMGKCVALIAKEVGSYLRWSPFLCHWYRGGTWVDIRDKCEFSYFIFATWLFIYFASNYFIYSMHNSNQLCNLLIFSVWCVTQLCISS